MKIVGYTRIKNLIASNLKNVPSISFMLLILALSLVLSGCTPAKPSPLKPASARLTVAAAISLSDALAELKQAFGKSYPNIEIQFTYGASGVLMQQIEHGSPIDVFISAGEKQMKDLTQQGLVLNDTVKSLTANQMVLIAPVKTSSSIQGFEDLVPKAKKIALGNPKTVPAGYYGKQVLEHYQIYSALLEKLVLAEDVRQALTMVATGNAEAGLVYRTDALSNSSVKIIANAPPESHDPIVYPIAVIQRSTQAEAARKFVEFALSAQGQQILSKYGFTNPEQ